jgi:tetratricopeptide (TPR) repeat protein
MKKRMMLVFGMIFAGTVFGGDFPQDYQSAMKLYNGGKYAESEEAFVKLTEQTSAPRGIDESLAYAAYSAEQQKKSDKALEFAGKIKDKSLNTFCRMKLLEIQKKWDAIVALSKDEDFEKWPDAMKYSAFVCRGNAYFRVRNAENAEKDFLAAMKNTVEKLEKATVYLCIGNVNRDLTNDKQKAIDSYAEVVKMMTDPKPTMSGGFLLKAGTAKATLLASEGKGEQAISELNQIFKEGEFKDPNWVATIYFCYGEVYQHMMKNTEALSYYRKAAAVEKAPEYLLKNANQKIEELGKSVQK